MYGVGNFTSSWKLDAGLRSDMAQPKSEQKQEMNDLVDQVIILIRRHITRILSDVLR